jgi:hypothetical protein
MYYVFHRVRSSALAARPAARPSPRFESMRARARDDKTSQKYITNVLYKKKTITVTPRDLHHAPRLPVLAPSPFVLVSVAEIPQESSSSTASSVALARGDDSTLIRRSPRSSMLRRRMNSPKSFSLSAVCPLAMASRYPGNGALGARGFPKSNRAKNPRVCAGASSRVGMCASKSFYSCVWRRAFSSRGVASASGSDGGPREFGSRIGSGRDDAASDFLIDYATTRAFIHSRPPMGDSVMKRDGEVS